MIQRPRPRETLRWGILGALLFASSYAVRRWFAARHVGGHQMSFSWLDVLVPAGVTAAAFVVLILLSKMVEFFRNYEKPRPSLSYPCPSCGFLVFTEPAGSFDICEICGWQDDIVQLADPTHGGGANSDSLARSQSVILKSLPLEILEHNGFRRDPRWRPLRDDDLKERSAEEPAYYWLQNEETGS